MGRIKGIGYKVEITYVKTEHGEETLQRILSTLMPGDRILLEGTILASDWHPQGPLERFRQAVARHFMDTELKTLEEMGRFSAQYALTGIYRVFMAVSSPAHVIKKVGNLFPKYFDHGKAEAVVHGPRDISIIISGWEDASATLCAVMKGYFERTLEMAGARGVEVKKVACVLRGDPVCEFRGTWT